MIIKSFVIHKDESITKRRPIPKQEFQYQWNMP